MRGRNTVNLLKAIDMLCRPGGVTINQLSVALEINRRSVHRLLNIIQDLNFPIYDERDRLGREKSWKMDADYIIKTPNINLPDIRFNIREVMALYFLRSESGIYAGTEIEADINAAFERLSLCVPEKFYDQIKKLKTLFISPRKLTKDYTGKEEVIDTLTLAMLKNTTCLVNYYSFMDDRTKKFRIDPLHFFESNGGLYLFVRATKYEDIRILAAERIIEIELLDELFEYPENFDPDEKLNSAFDMVYDDPIELEVLFSKSQAKYIKERQFSPDQMIVDNDDGSVTLKMKTSGWFDVKKWLLGFGSTALVVKPEEMREEIIEEMKNGLELYKNNSL